VLVVASVALAGVARPAFAAAAADPKEVFARRRAHAREDARAVCRGRRAFRTTRSSTIDRSAIRPGAT
jgi:hypothetical protein